MAVEVLATESSEEERHHTFKSTSTWVVYIIVPWIVDPYSLFAIPKNQRNHNYMTAIFLQKECLNK
jgi:hypothetical protein